MKGVNDSIKQMLMTKKADIIIFDLSEDEDKVVKLFEPLAKRMKFGKIKYKIQK